MDKKLDPVKFRGLIKDKGRTRAWLAEQCGISISYINAMVTGGRTPSRPILMLLAQRLECREDDLLVKGRAS